MNDQEQIVEQAVAWHLASASDAMDWDLFTVWLEADPRHAAAYDELALSDAALKEHAPELQLATSMPAPPARSTWRVWGGLALAASLAAVLAAPLLVQPDPRHYATAATGQTIALKDGSEVQLAPHSNLAVAGDESRLELQGGGYFNIRHDPGRQLTVRAGGLEISDIGTRFDVQADPGGVRLGVSEGQVQVSAPQLARSVTLRPGKLLSFDAQRGSADVRDIAAVQVGEWRSGRLTYDQAPLALVAHDLSRYAGTSVKVSTDLESQRFSGTLSVGNGAAALTDLAQLMGLHLRRDAGGYRLDR